MRDNRFPLEQRNFETRLLFINEIFSNLFSQEDIMAHCIEHKLDRSYIKYVKELEKSALNLEKADPLKVLRTIDE